MHEVWKVILDDEFTKAYAQGFLVTFVDSIVCCIFPQIFMYSAEYPEK
jgi:hypothetical protein